MQLPEEVATRISSAWPGRGAEWASDFPRMLDRAIAHWNLDDIRPFSSLSYHFVARARRHGERVVLKLGLPEPEIQREASALAAFGGPCARLLDVRLDLAALLLEDVQPGAALEEMWREEQDVLHTQVLAETMAALWREPPKGFPTLQEWMGALDRTSAAVPGPLLAAAERIWRELEESAPPSRLLHGDLHHGNVLQSLRGYVAIDPKGVIGEPGFEIYALLRNPISASAETLERLVEPRIEKVAPIVGIPGDRLLRLGFVGAVLSCCWSAEESSLGSGELRLAQFLLEQIHGKC